MKPFDETVPFNEIPERVDLDSSLVSGYLTWYSQMIRIIWAISSGGRQITLFQYDAGSAFSIFDGPRTTGRDIF